MRDVAEKSRKNCAELSFVHGVSDPFRELKGDVQPFTSYYRFNG